ncbi:MAG TPA: GSCFA domain-containing protein [Saprospiraceae bacterium]|nr:GSCFA domain-containing protein [Saprospiraceae bacterium]
MDHLITRVEIPHYHPKISYKDHLLVAGSCFAEHMDTKLTRYKYRVLCNPFGILFNPASIAKSFQRIEKKQLYTANELVQHDGLYHSMDHHGSYSAAEEERVLQKINNSIDHSHQFLQQCKFVFVSLGTARVYRYKSSGDIAGNNHKIPLIHFDPEVMNVDDCVAELEKIYVSIKRMSSDARIIWTVSPVRHIRDGLVESTRSKAALLLAIERMTLLYPDTNYFPAYEVMMDQLRDYRFYARDMIHPSETAVDIIWEILSEKYFESHELIHHAALEKIMKAREHRIMHENKTSIRTFAEGQLRNIDHLSSLLPELNLKEEKQYFFNMIEPD